VFNSGVRRVRSLVLAMFVVAAFVVAIVAAPAAAAQPPVHLGQAANEFNSGLTGTGFGSCECTVAQFHDVGPAGSSYTIPFDGVLVGSGFYLGNLIEPTDTVQLQTVHKSGAFGGTVVSEGAAHSIFGRTKKAVAGFYDRVPAQAGDVLAARFETGHTGEATPFFFKAAAGDETRISNSPRAAGESLEPATALAPERRINLEAVLEPDEDHDGYGDVSQDLCPGSPIATSACSGALLGSSLQGERSLSGGVCGGSGCTRIEKTVGGVSTAAPFDGVVVRWRILTASFSGTYRARVVAPLGDIGGGFSTYRILRSSESEFISALAISPLMAKISSFETRMPIAAGDYVGLTRGPQGEGFQASSGAATYFESNEPGLDGNGITGTTHNGTVLYDADIEPDVDGDGYGDVTQDSCPSASAIHEGQCPAVAADVAGSSGGGAAATGPRPIAPPPNRPSPPTIGSLAVKPKSFHAKPLGPAPQRSTWGTKVKLSLSRPATVALAIEARHGRRFRIVTRLSKKSAAGKDSIAFNGQYRHAGEPTELPAGTYRLSASAGDAAGTGPVERTTFTVLPSA
jgi:hypothetical protein